MAYPLPSSAPVATPSRFSGAMLVLATVLFAWSTAHAQSIFCSLKRCDDGDPCTVDSCRGLGTCIFEPVRCDDGDACTVDQCDATGTCRFTANACDDHNPCTTDACVDGGCVSTALADGEPCEDDGFTCTEDACTGGSCLHVPIDSRCVGPGECTSATCAPQVPGADAAGCLVGGPLAEGAECAEDGHPCTDDVCRPDGCVHQSVPNLAMCDPVMKPFRLALVLVAQARAVAANILRLADEADPVAARALSRLAQAEVALRDAARTLAGRSAFTITGRAGGLELTVAQLRAVAATGQTASVPGHVREAVLTLRRLSPSPDPELLALTIERARSLRRGVRRLKIELRRVRRVQQTFVP